jgi:mono/diheme cytochrome c family protein
VKRIGSVAALPAIAIAAVLLAGQANAAANARAQEPSANNLNGSNGNIQNGKRVFASQNCGQCHGSEGQGQCAGGCGSSGPSQVFAPRIGPPRISLAMFMSQVREPMKPMPPYSAKAISDAELADLYAFLSSLPPAPAAESSLAGDAENGKRVFMADGCFECHNTEGQGGGGGPKLAPNPIGFAAFTHQLRSPARQMPPYAITVLSDQEVADIYAFLRSRPEPPKADSIPLLN